MSDSVRLTPEEACERLARDPESLWWSIDEFSLQMGLALAETMAELRSGRLEARGVPVPGGGYRDTIITAASYLRWKANRRTPKRLTRKIDAHLKRADQ